MSVHAGIDRKTEGKDVQEGLDVEVVGGEDDFKEHLLVDLDKLGVPVRDLGRLAAGVVLILGEGFGVLCGVRTTRGPFSGRWPKRWATGSPGPTRRHLRAGVREWSVLLYSHVRLKAD